MGVDVKGLKMVEIGEMVEKNGKKWAKTVKKW